MDMAWPELSKFLKLSSFTEVEKKEFKEHGAPPPPSSSSALGNQPTLRPSRPLATNPPFAHPRPLATNPL